MTMVRSRITGAVGTAAIVLLTLGVPAVVAVAPVTRFVDDDGHASANGCNAGATAYTTIQSAIGASGVGDTVAVCPGTYQQQLKIGPDRTNLHLISVEAFGARILSPATLTDDATLLRIQAQGVLVQGFRFQSLATASGCEPVFAAIHVMPGATAVIRGNRISTAGTESFGGPCGYQIGVFAGSADGTATIEATKVQVLWNSIKDFQVAGAAALGNTAARIDQNSIQFLHGGMSPFAASEARGASPARERLTDAPTGFCQRASADRDTRAARLTRALRAPRAGAPAGSSGDFSVGIALALGAYGVANRNHVYSGVPAGCSPLLFVGMLVGTPNLSAAGSPIAPFGVSILRENIVTVSLANYWLGQVSDVTMTDNVGSINEIGVYLDDADGNSISGHDDRAGGRGIWLKDTSSENTIEDSVFLDNSDVDCMDESTGTGSGGTANTWTNVQGDTANRPGICIPGVVPGP